MASRAIPSHLKPSAAEGSGEGGFSSQRHHGKSQSHVVRTLFSLSIPLSSLHKAFMALLFGFGQAMQLLHFHLSLTAFDEHQLGALWVPSRRRVFAVVYNTPPKHGIHTALLDGIRQYQEINTHGPPASIDLVFTWTYATLPCRGLITAAAMLSISKSSRTRTFPPSTC